MRARLLLLPLALALASGCAPARRLVAGGEARAAAEFFARAAARAPFPAAASFTGRVDAGGYSIPFLAGVKAPSPAEEIVGFYDPLGRPILYLSNDGARLVVSPGEAAKELGFGDIPPASSVPADSLSLARVLLGAPGYPVSDGEAGREADGGWTLSGERQTLYSDALHRHVRRAEYEIFGRRVRVTYPDRDADGPPRTVVIESRGATMMLRRDEE